MQQRFWRQLFSFWTIIQFSFVLLGFNTKLCIILMGHWKFNIDTIQFLPAFVSSKVLRTTFLTDLSRITEDVSLYAKNS